MSVLRPLWQGLFPASVERTAARAGTICLTLAVCVAAFFPVSAHAGTEVPAARWTTTGALGVAWLLLRWSGGRLPVVGAGVAALVAGSLAAPAPWLLLVAGGACVYVATSLIPRRRAEWRVDDEGRAGASDVARLGAPVATIAAGQVVVAEAETPLEATQELLESVAMALVLALVVREFGFEAFKIPTGSMEPTILGDGFYAGGKRRRGDRLLAFKVTEYRRWDVVVFRFPLFRNTNYIKRLIGLPGERVEIRDGDIYAGPDAEHLAIAPKPDDVQALMWRRALAPGTDEDWTESFDREEGSAFTFGTGYAEVDPATSGDGVSAADANGVAWTQLRGSFEEDQRITFDVEIRRPGGELYMSLEGGRRRCELRLTDDGCTVTTPGAVWKPALAGLASLGPKFRLGFSASDRVVRVYLGDRQVDSFQHPDVTNDALDAGRVRLGAKGLSAVFRDLVVERDVQYQMYETTSWDVPDDGYVMLGDNTGSSRDSRYWRANLVRTKDGREFVAPDSARLSEDAAAESTVFFERPDGSVEFVDSYGIPHRFAKDEIAEIRRRVPCPFARESDLVGRAFFIFFPFPPVGDFRMRLLR